MGCLNNKIETQKLPTAPLQDPQQELGQFHPEQHPKGIAFDIPVNENKPKRTKPNKLNKQLYIIREVSNVNHQLVQSPMKQPKKEEKELSVKILEDYEPVIIRKRTKTSKEISVSSDENDEVKTHQLKTANFIPQDTENHQYQNELAEKRIQRRKVVTKSRQSDNRSALSRYSHESQELANAKAKKRRASLDQKTLEQHSIHYKRARTLHNEDQLVQDSKSISVNRDNTEAMSVLPVFIHPPNLGMRNFQAEIQEIISKEGEDSSNLLELYHNLAAELEKKGVLDQALAANSKYLRIARKTHGIDTCSYAAGLSNLSSICYSLSNYEKAIENSMKAKSIRSFANIEGDMHKARVLNEIGLIELEQNHIKEATHYLQEVREIHLKVVSELKVEIQDLLAEPPITPSKSQYYDKSVKSMELALRICTRVFGENHLQTANHLDDLGTSYCDAGRYNESLMCYQRCFNIMKMMRLSKHKDFQSHSKHFNYNLELIKLNSTCSIQVLETAIKILESFFPSHDFLVQLKARLSSLEAKEVDRE